jgi:mono/diheme cytochrome c family protein
LAKGADFLRAATREGIPGTSMLAFEGRLADHEIEDVIAFLKSWGTGAQAQPTPAPEATPTTVQVQPSPTPEATPTSAQVQLSPTPEATPTAKVPTLGGDAAKGAELFAANCAVCHGSEGRGAAVAEEPLNSAEFLGGRSDDDLDQAISDGVEPAMPPFGGRLTAQEIEDIIAFFRGWE